MAETAVDFQELRFVVNKNETHVYVLLEASRSPCPSASGWHFKEYPIGVPVGQILKLMFSGGEDHDPVLWPHQAPPREAE